MPTTNEIKNTTVNIPDKIILENKYKNSGITKRLFTVEETAYILSISVKSVRRLLERKLLKSNPALRVKLITLESIEAFAQMTL